MPIFGRRQTQRMLNELEPWLTSAKATDLVKRLDHKQDPDQVLPAEYELALSWAVSKVAHLEIDRPLGGRTPDIWSDNLVANAATVIDVAALSDDPFSGESLMRRAANIINSAARRYRKDAPDHLYFEFQEERGYLPANRWSGGFTRYFRKRRITKKFRVTPEIEGAVSGWLSQGVPSSPLRVRDDEVDVVIRWKDYVHPHANTFSSMPSVIYDARDNALYDRLREKARQVRSAPDGVRRGIFLGDAGCALLRDLRPLSGGSEVSGAQVIQAFMSDFPIDFVAVFTPKRANEYATHHFNPRLWHINVFDNRPAVPDHEYDQLFKIREILPDPYLHGYQARSWHQQGMFDPQGQGQYLPLRWTGGKGPMTVRLSARGLQELLAGRIDHKQFENWIVGEKNIFELQLARGKMISSVSFEPKGPEEDDDYVVVEFADDLAASPLTSPKGAKPSTPS